jgi:hypothetical protein
MSSVAAVRTLRQPPSATSLKREQGEIAADAGNGEPHERI